MAKSLKKKAWYWCSRYCRLRDALEYCNKMGIDLSQFNRPEDLPVKCCTCNSVKSWIRFDAGHFISRGLGGSSGVYFDTRNIHAQSKDCNAWKQGAPKEYDEFMREKYGQAVMDELLFQHHIAKKHNYFLLEEYYKHEYKKLVDKT